MVGAGASSEFHMPVGNELTGMISVVVNLKYDSAGRRVSGEEDIENALRQTSVASGGTRSTNRYWAACNAIVGGMREAPSIDAFIHQRRNEPDIEVVGKIGIVYCILHQERVSNLHYDYRNVDDTINFAQVQQTWIAELRQLLTGGCTVDEVADRLDQVKIISFNYDRCIEHYFLHSIRNTYGLSERDAIELTDRLDVIHPYGTVGELPRQGLDKAVPYGELSLHGRLHHLASGIRTFTEQAEDEEEQEKLGLAIQDSELIIFLGFHYHEQNVQLLAQSMTGNARRVMGTAFGISKENQSVIKKLLADSFCGGQIGAVVLDDNKKCFEYMRANSQLFGTISV